MRSISARRKSSRNFGSITTLNGVAAGSALARLCFLAPVCSVATIWKSRFSAMSILPIVDLNRYRSLLKENRNDQDRDDICYLDHRIDRGTGGVLVRVAHRVAGHCGSVRERTFTAKISFLDKFFRVVPGAAAGRHGDRDK